MYVHMQPYVYNIPFSVYQDDDELYDPFWKKECRKYRENERTERDREKL